MSTSAIRQVVEQLEASPECRRLDEDPQLELLAEIAESKLPFSRELSERVRGACLEFVAAAGARSLEACFGWEPCRGKHSMGRRLAEARLLAAIGTAWRAMEGCDRLKDWPRCRVLLAEMADFEVNYLPTWRSDGPPSGASRLRRALYQAFTAVSRPLPKTENGLFELLKRARVLN